MHNSKVRRMRSYIIMELDTASSVFINSSRTSKRRYMSS